MKRTSLAARLAALALTLSVTIPARAAERSVIVNGTLLTPSQLAVLDRHACGVVPDGRYWLELDAGTWGYEGNTQPQGHISDGCRAQESARRPSLSERGALYKKDSGEKPDGGPTPYAIVEILFATDRARTADPRPATYFGGDRGELQLGRAEVSVPRDHRMGVIERPSIWRAEFRSDPSKHVVLLSIESTTSSEFVSRLRARVTASSERAAFVFVHGYNVSFEDAALRTGQLAYDLAFDGAPILYSWPSQGKAAAYPVDETNVDWTVPHLQSFLEMVASQSGATTIHVIGHSMGNRAVVGALRAMPEQRSGPMVLREVVLTAPDIDAEVFQRDIASEIRKRSQRVTLYASSNDAALKASKVFHGYSRAGEVAVTVTVARGIDTVDASAVDTSLVGHSYYGENRSILSDIFYLLKEGKSPEHRFGLTPISAPAGRYWLFKP